MKFNGKILKRILIWICIPIIAEFAAFFLIDKYYVAPITNFKESKVDIRKNKVHNALQANVPNGVTNIKVSYDGKYAAYVENDCLKFIDMSTQKITEIKNDNNMKLSYYRWLPDLNRIIIAEKTNLDSGENYIKFYTYDVSISKKEKTQIVDNHGNEFKINIPVKNADVDDMVISKTHVSFIKLTLGGSRTIIYDTNAMNQLEKTNIKDYSVGPMFVPYLETRLVYQNKMNGSIEVSDKLKVDFSSISKACLLGSDFSDNIYVGDTNTGKVSSVSFGTIDKPVSQWTNIKLPEEAAQKNVIISNTGNIYVNDMLKGKLIDSKTQKQYSYKGEFLQLFNNGIISTNNGKILEVNINK